MNGYDTSNESQDYMNATQGGYNPNLQKSLHAVPEEQFDQTGNPVA